MSELNIKAIETIKPTITGVTVSGINGDLDKNTLQKAKKLRFL